MAKIKSACWKEGYSPDRIARKLENAKKIQPGGDVEFDWLSSSGVFIVLFGIVDVGIEIPDLEKKRIIALGTSEAGRKGTITKETLLAEINRLKDEYLNLPSKKYSLVTTISINAECEIKPQTFNGTTILFGRHVSGISIDERKTAEGQAALKLDVKLPKDYLIVQAQVATRSEAEAAKLALDAIDLLRTIWNLGHNQMTSSRWSSGRRHPVNGITLGPIHTLHKSDGKVIDGIWWYQLEYQGPMRLHDMRKDAAAVQKYSNQIQRQLKKSLYRAELESALLRYGRALDSTDWEGSFLKLWGVLEQLTATRADESHKFTAKRASTIWKDRQYVLEVLNHLRDFRNQSVHAGRESSYDMEALLYQLKGYVETLFRFHLFHASGFQDIEEVARFLDLPGTRPELLAKEKSLKDQMKRVQRMKRFITPKQPVPRI